MSKLPERENFSEFFIRRPLAALVLNLLILLLGLYSLWQLPVRLYPKIDSYQIAITTEYPGASAEVIQGYITRTIASQVAGVDGLDFTHTKSIQGQSTVTMVLKMGADGDKALIEVMTRLQQVKYLLPAQAYDPQVVKTATGSMPLFYIGFCSDTVSTEAITDFLNRDIQPQIAAVAGVAQADILGAGTYAMRVDLDPLKMAALGISALQVQNALLENDFRAAPGQSEGTWVVSDIQLDSSVSTPEEFRRLVIKSTSDGLLRLEDVAKVELGPSDLNMINTMDGKPAVFITVSNTSSANPLEVGQALKRTLIEIKPLLPPGVTAEMGYDATLFIRASVNEVFSTMSMTVGIVILVITLFLATWRSVVIPVIALPLSMIGACTLMLFMGFSLNILSMLAIILAIGLVVDDAILVAENTTRHIESGKPPMRAAIDASNEVGFAICGMTVTIVAVFSPLAFTGGLTGSLFREFAMTLAGAVVASAVVALTLSPVMGALVLKPNSEKSRLEKFLDQTMQGLSVFYRRTLSGFIDQPAAALLIAFTLLVSCIFLYSGTPQELAPAEDQSIFVVQGTGPQYANSDYLELFANELNTIATNIPEMEHSFVMTGYPDRQTVFGIYSLRPWDKRSRSQSQILNSVSPAIQNIAGLQCYTFGLPTLPGSSGLPVQVVLTTDLPNSQLYQSQEKLVNAGMTSGLFTFLQGSLKFNTPLLKMRVNRSKAAELGITMADLGQEFSLFTSDAYINRFIHSGMTYQVIPRLDRSRLTDEELLQGEIRTASGDMVPLSSLLSLERGVNPNALTQFDQLNSATISGSLAPGVTLGQALEYLQQTTKDSLPPSFKLDYTGETRQYVQEGNRLLIAFFVAIFIIFLVLAAQFNSLRVPLIVLITVPGALCGALIPLYLGMATINIFTQVGLLTLTGLIAKHSIMIVVMANKMQLTQNLSRKEAALEGALIRLRPFLMTSSAMAVGMIPLLFADGAGAHSRFDIGLVLFSGLFFGSVATLIVMPVLYSLMAENLQPQKE